MERRYEASLLLSATGDSIGYRRGMSGFCRSGPQLHADMSSESPLGVNGVTISAPSWTLSDATVLRLATAEAVVNAPDGADLAPYIAISYVEAMKDTLERSLGHTTTANLRALYPDCSNWNLHPYHPREGGCNPAVRASVIGLLLPCEDDLERLVTLAVQSCLITHHHPTAFLGAAAAAAFTSFAVRGVPVREWGNEMLLKVVPIVEALFEEDTLLAAEGNNVREMHTFLNKWTSFLEARQLPRPGTKVDRGSYLCPPPAPVYPEPFGVRERDEWYTSLSFSGWGGASGDDATIIAYDALVGGTTWEQVCSRSMLHGGDSASTGALAGGWFGAMNGFQGVPECHYSQLEYRDRLSQCAAKVLRCAARMGRRE